MKLSIRKNTIPEILFACMVFVFCFSNRYLELKFTTLSALMAYMRLVIALGVAVLSVVEGRKWSRTTILTIVLAGWIFLSSILNGVRFTPVVNRFAPIILILLSLDYIGNKKAAMHTLIGTWMWLMVFLSVIDLLSFLAFPDGMYKTEFYPNNWFLGYKTERMIYTLPMVMIAFYKFYEDRLSFVTVYSVSLLAFAGTYLAGATAGTLVFLMVIAMATLIKFAKTSDSRKISRFLGIVLSFRFILAVYLLITFLIVIEQKSELVSYVSAYFGKRDGLSSRTDIWQACLSLILKRPVQGYGLLDSDFFLSITRNVYGGTNAHNMFLTLGMDGGIIAVALYLFMVIQAVRSAREDKGGKYILCIEIYAMLLLGITSSIMVFSQFSMLAYWMIENMMKYDKGSVLNYVDKIIGRNSKIRFVQKQV